MTGKRPVKNRTILLLCAVAMLWVFLVGASMAADSSTIPWWTVDGGGGQSAGGGYAVTGTIGQVDTGISSGGSYQLSGGFWGAESASVAAPEGVFLPLITR